MTSPSVPSFIPQLETEMNVTKRNGDLETVSFDKILKRMKRQGPEIKVNYTALAMKVIDQLYDGISTTKIDELSAEQCASMASVHPDYNTLAGRIIVSSHQKNTQESFTTVMTELYEFKDKNGEQSPLVSDELMAIILENPDIDNLCDYSRDFLVDYFGFKTLDRAYLMKIGGKAVERPQHMWLRVAIGIHGFDLAKVKETYDLMSQKYFTHATPTLFNAGTPRPQLSSCFLNAMESDSIDGIYNTLKECALISKHAGGIGLHIHNIRATGSHIRGTNGTSNGIVPMLRVFNNTAKYVDQCLTPETIILSSNGPMRIDQIVPGVTAVYNMTGETEVVQNVLQHYQQDEIFEIINVGSSPNVMTVTGAHQIYVLRGYVDQSETVIKNDLDLRIAQFEWVEAKDLTTNDFLVFSVPKGEQDFSELTSDVCYVYGLLLSGTTNVIENNIQTTQTTENIEYIENFLTSNSIQYEIVSEDGLTIQWPITPNLPFLSSDFYTMMNISSFRMSKRWIFLPREKTTRLLDGLGNFQPLYVDMFFLNLRLGHIYDYENNKQEVDINYGDFLIVPIKSVRKTTYWGVVFDLQMTTEHNYLTQQGIVHNGGGKRNGSFAIYLEPWHADIEMFLQMRKNHGDEELKARDLFYALWIPDLFMERVKTNGTWTLMCPDECPGLADVYGPAFKELYEKYEQEGKGRSTVQARELWFKVLDAQMETGTPYLCYKDAANQKSNQKNVGVIKSSNLCVAPETVILTDKGHIQIQTLEDKTVNVWNGTEFSEVTVKKTGTDQELINVYTDDGLKLSCTPYHKFYVQNKYSFSSIRQKEARNLKPDDKLIKCNYPIIDGSDNMLYPYTHGFFCGDGTYRNITDQEPTNCKFNASLNHHFCKRHLCNETETYLNENIDIKNYSGKCKAMSYNKLPIVYLYDNKKELLQYIESRLEPINEEKNNRISVSLPVDMPEKYEVPSNNCSIKTKLEWFAGYCDADGSIAINGTNEQLQVASINHEFLVNIKLMLQTCGINPKLKLSTAREQSYLPDGKGGYKYFDTQPVYRLLITSYDLYNLVQLGFNPHRLVISGTLPQRNAKQFIKILKIENKNRISDTYCFTEPKKHMGIFNGILTGQCSEIMEYSDANETAVCNLASIGLPTYIRNEGDKKVFDYEKLHEVAKVVTKNLNKIIDVNYYPTEKTRKSNMRHRPIGIGIQGLADVFLLLGHAFLSEEARQINRDIFETIYHGALESSCELAAIEGPYETWAGCPASEGKLQFDLWGVQPSGRYDWAGLKEVIKTKGLRNSLLLAPMPTASTSQILGFNECIEPITSNIYSRRTIAGEFIQVNRYLIEELIGLGVWNEKVKNNIIANHGSIQQLDFISQEVKDKYKTVWEMPMRGLIDMAADRGAFICQSQSLNLWLEDPNYNTLTAMHFYGWQKGLKTGMYYLRRRGKHQAQQFTIEPEKAQHVGSSYEEEICELCSA